VVVTRGDRFIVRAYSPPDTVGGGLVLDPLPPRGGIRTTPGRARFSELDPSTSADPARATERAALLLAAEAGHAGLPRAALTARLGLLTNDARGPVEQLRERGALVAVGTFLVAPSQLEHISRRCWSWLRRITASTRWTTGSRGKRRVSGRVRAPRRACSSA